MVTLGCGMAAGILAPAAALWVTALAACLSRYRVAVRPWARASWAIGILAIALLLAVHRAPGFANPQLLRDTVVSPGGAPYSLYVNFDKTIAGLLVLGIGAGATAGSARAWRATFTRAAPILAATVAIAMAASVALAFVRFEPRWTPLFWIWAPINLLSTCVSEEAFFRAFLQRETARALEGRGHAAAIAVAVSAVAFGLAHAAGGWRYVLLATLAGTGYALAFQRTGRVEAAMLTHFAVNATHFLLFTYPSLA